MPLERTPQDSHAALGCFDPGYSLIFYIHTKAPLTQKKILPGESLLFIECHLPHGLIQPQIFPLQPTPFRLQLMSYLTLQNC